jgi:alpha-L-arabinofuranosidase
MTFDAEITLDVQSHLGALHDHLYGANLEHIGRSIYQGHWAEMLNNRKFLGHDKMYVGLSEGLSHQNPAMVL